MYAKLINNTLRTAPKRITWQSRTVDNPTPEQLADMGYLPVTYTAMPPNSPSGQHYEPYWTQTDTEIVQAWKLVDDQLIPEPEPTPEERLESVEKRTDALETTTDDMILLMADLIGGN